MTQKIDFSLEFAENQPKINLKISHNLSYSGLIYLRCAAGKLLIFEQLISNKNGKKILGRIQNGKIFFLFKNPIFYRLKYRFFCFNSKLMLWMAVLNSHFLTIVFFWVKNLRAVNEFVSTTVVSPLHTLDICYFLSKFFLNFFPDFYFRFFVVTSKNNLRFRLKVGSNQSQESTAIKIG